MILKKPDRKKADRSRRTLVSPSLDSALRGTTQTAPSQEPWRDHKRKGNKRKK